MGVKALDRVNYYCARAIATLADRSYVLIALAIARKLLPLQGVEKVIIWGHPASDYAPWLIFSDMSLALFTGLPCLSWLAALLIYCSFSLARHGATPGMRWAELRLVTEDGRTPSLPRILLRHAASVVSAATIIGYIWPLFDFKGRALHDVLAGTLVVHEDHPAGTWG